MCARMRRGFRCASDILYDDIGGFCYHAWPDCSVGQISHGRRRHVDSITVLAVSGGERRKNERSSILIDGRHDRAVDMMMVMQMMLKELVHTSLHPLSLSTSV